jgi:exodeoxyribonuclease-3
MKKFSRLFILLTLVFICTSFSSVQQQNFTVITYNVWNGFEAENQRRDTFVKWARQQNADVIAFQELNNFTQVSFSELARTWGHTYVVISKEKGYPVGISSRYPIKNVYRLIEGMHHGCLYAEINGISFFVVHFSPFSSVKRGQEADAVIKYLEQKNKLNDQTIILGDFNSFSPVDSLFYATSGARDSMFAAETKNKILQNLNVKHQIDYRVVSRFFNWGFNDSFALFHKTFERSYPTKVFGSVAVSNECRIDHLLISKKLMDKCQSLQIVKDSITDTLSDHYPLKSVWAFH